MLPSSPTKRRHSRWHGALLLALGLALALSLGACGSTTQESDAANSNAPADIETEGGDQPTPAAPADIPSDVPAEAYVTAEKAKELVDNGAHVMDIRNRYNFANGHILSARNVASGKSLEIGASHYDPTDLFLIVADKEELGENAWKTLAGLGIPLDNIMILDGGMEAWLAADMPYETSEIEGC